MNTYVTSLRRSGMTASGLYGVIDDLELSYGAFYFRDGADSDEEYSYDRNGSLTSDLNRGISV